MSSKYQKLFTIPEGFPALLKAFTREILRKQPGDIYEFGSTYFTDLLEQQRAFVPEAMLDNLDEHIKAFDLLNASAGDVENFILELFMEADADQSGYLDRQEFSHVMKSSKLGLNKKQIRLISQECDENDDGVIEYREFVPIMLDVISSMKAAYAAEEAQVETETAAREYVEEILIHGMSPQQLESMMRKVFTKADKDKSGFLSRDEFKDCLKSAELGLTRRDINLLLSQIDVNEDGVITYDEFVPLCREVLVERFKEELMTNDIMNTQDGLQQVGEGRGSSVIPVTLRCVFKSQSRRTCRHQALLCTVNNAIHTRVKTFFLPVLPQELLRAFKKIDPEDKGTLAPKKVRSALEELSFQVLGLTAFQVLSLVSQAPRNPEGLVEYIKFVPTAALMIYSMFDSSAMKHRLEAIHKLAANDSIAFLSELDYTMLHQILTDSFKEADTEGTGELTYDQVVDVINDLSWESLSTYHISAMLAAIDTDGNGMVDWQELANFLCDVLEHVEREKYINDQAMAAWEEA